MVLLEYFLLFRKILFLISETRIYCLNLQEDAKMFPLSILSNGIPFIFHTFDLTLAQFYPILQHNGPTTLASFFLNWPLCFVTLLFRDHRWLLFWIMEDFFNLGFLIDYVYNRLQLIGQMKVKYMYLMEMVITQF